MFAPLTRRTGALLVFSASLLLIPCTAAAVQFAAPADLAIGIGFTTVVAVGPEDPDPSSPADGCIYAINGEKGEVHRICFDAAKTVTSSTVVVDLNGTADAEFTLGLAFDPASDPAGEIVLYIAFAENGQQPFNSKIARAVSGNGGASYTVDEDFITGLPRGRAQFDHGVNGIQFGPDGCLYIAQGANSDFGYGDIAAESRMSGAILRACFRHPDGQIDPAFDRNCGVGATQQACDVEVYASGLRNPYDLAWHSNGFLYATDNDPNGDEVCADAANTFGCDCEQVADAPGDELNLVEPGMYYGSPNPYLAHPDALQCQGGTTPSEACTINANCGVGGTCEDLSALCTDDECGDPIHCHYFGFGDDPKPGEDPGGIYRKPIAQVAALLDGMAEYRSPPRFAGGFCADWLGDLIVGGARNNQVRRFELLAAGRQAQDKGGINLHSLRALDVAVGADGTIYGADFTNGKVTYLKPVAQPDPAAIDFFRRCDVTSELGQWDVPAKPAPLPVPATEYGAASLRIGGKDYVFLFGSDMDTSRVLRYDVAANTWASSDDAGTSGPPPAKPFPFNGPPAGDHKVAVTLGERIVIIGAIRPFNHDTWAYDGLSDPDPGKLSNIGCNGATLNCSGLDNVGGLTDGGLPLGATAAVLLDDKIYIAGGLCPTSGKGSINCTCNGVQGGMTGNCTGNVSPGQNTDRAFVYHPDTDDWFEIAPLPVAVDHASGAAFGGKFYVFGGRQCGSNTACEARNLVQIYDPSTDSWSAGAPMPEGCSGMGAAVVMNDRIYVIGGEGGSCTGKSVQEYNPLQDTWRFVAGMPSSHHGIWPVRIGDPGDGVADRVFVLGGAPATTTANVFAFDCEECRGGVLATVGPPPPPIEDRDGDGVADAEDNCAGTPNADQADDDGDRLGDACDPCPGNPRNLNATEGGDCIATSTALFRINAGATGAFTDTKGLVWSADAHFTGGNRHSTIDPIGQTEDDSVYQSERNGIVFSYSLAVGSAGVYLVNLHFAEIFAIQNGKRVFDVFMPDASSRVLRDLDIHALAGHDNALVRSFVVETSDATLGMTFDSSQGFDRGKLSGIEVFRLALPGTTTTLAPGTTTTLGTTTTTGIGSTTTVVATSTTLGATTTTLNLPTTTLGETTTTVSLPTTTLGETTTTAVSPTTTVGVTTTTIAPPTTTLLLPTTTTVPPPTTTLPLPTTTLPPLPTTTLPPLPTTTLPPLPTTTMPILECFNNGDCDDGLFCNGRERCRLFVGCEAGQAPEVPDDGIECTIDRCDEENARIVHQPNDAACADDDPCTRDVCDPFDGCVNTAVNACDDGIACTRNDRCKDGVCAGVPNCGKDEICNLLTGVCEPEPEEGCSVNFWKENVDEWASTSLEPEESFDDRFDVDAFEPDISLLEAVNLGTSPPAGGSGSALEGPVLAALARQAVTAMLNARHPDLNFPLSKEQVKDIVVDVVNGDVNGQEALDRLIAANALGCPLGIDFRKGDANNDGLITAVDALITLRAAVGSATCALEVCDIDENGSITAPDALLVLRAAVGVGEI